MAVSFILVHTTYVFRRSIIPASVELLTMCTCRTGHGSVIYCVSIGWRWSESLLQYVVLCPSLSACRIFRSLQSKLRVMWADVVAPVWPLPARLAPLSVSLSHPEALHLQILVCLTCFADPYTHTFLSPYIHTSIRIQPIQQTITSHAYPFVNSLTYLNKTWLVSPPRHTHFVTIVTRADTKVIKDIHVKPVSLPPADNLLVGSVREFQVQDKHSTFVTMDKVGVE